jgi:hypothetical protein
MSPEAGGYEPRKYTCHDVLTAGFWQVALFRGRRLFPGLGKPWMGTEPRNIIHSPYQNWLRIVEAER